MPTQNAQHTLQHTLQRTIFHLDLDAFYCAVEEIFTPTLKGKAFMVGGRADQRGVVSSASYPARKFGVRSAMPTSQALRLCPRLIVVPGRYEAYSDYSHKVMNLLREYGETLQQISVDEAFLDLTGFSSDPKSLALEIQKRIKDELQLPASIGVAASKLVAKMASGQAKPNGVLVIASGNEASFLAPMDVGELWGVGKATVPRLEMMGIKTIGDLQRANPVNLTRVFGNQAEQVIERARGIDRSPVEVDRETKSISEERTFARDISDREELRKMLLHLSDAVAARLRKHGYFAKTIHLKLRWHDFKTVTRQTTLGQPTQLGEAIFAAVQPLWLATWHTGERVRLLGVGASTLSEGLQLSIFDDEQERKIALAKAVDQLREQYGGKIVTRASLRKGRI
ncbi:MAG: DNA polymerase IV [Anaerolineae bacterium]|nr:DNA polymerase IV [Anaerolineae bacterium]